MFQFIHRIRQKWRKRRQKMLSTRQYVGLEKLRIMLRLWGLTIAELIDAWRVGPRAILSGYSYLMWDVIHWYMSIPSTNVTPNMAQAMLVSIVVGSAGAIFGFYVHTGRRWQDTPNVTDGSYDSNLNTPTPKFPMPDINQLPNPQGKPSATPQVTKPIDNC